MPIATESSTNFKTEVKYLEPSKCQVYSIREKFDLMIYFRMVNHKVMRRQRHKLLHLVVKRGGETMFCDDDYT